jgi:coenzyme PQQ synthesis protein D (PqqD)
MTDLRLRQQKLQWLETEGEVVALDEETLTYLGANESGALLWQELAAGATREQLISKLVSTFGIVRESAARDVDAFIAQLESHGLLEA